MEQILKQTIKIAIDAGNKIMEYYEGSIAYSKKEDASPLTDADLESNSIIKKGLKNIDSKIEILSEEESDISWNIRKDWDKFWLVDPLDGTKEFIKKNGEFTVNICLLDKNSPIIGVIYAPFLKTLYYGAINLGSFKHKNIINFKHVEILNKKFQIKCKKNKKLLIVASRSHHSKLLDNWLLDKKNYEMVDAGSSLKFCMLAEGKADIYPRFVGSSEWDIAAGCVILEEAGGKILDINNKKLLFNKKSIRNNFFIASNGFS